MYSDYVMAPLDITYGLRAAVGEELLIGNYDIGSARKLAKSTSEKRNSSCVV